MNPNNFIETDERGDFTVVNEEGENKMNNFNILKEKLASKIIELRNDGDLYVVNRFSDDGFLDIFKDSLFFYEKNCILLERFFYKDSIEDISIPIPKISEDSFEAIDTLEKMQVDISNFENLDDSKKSEIEQTINNIRATLDKDEKKEIENVIIPCFRTPLKTIPLMPLQDLDDKAIEAMSTLISHFCYLFVKTLISFGNDDIENASLNIIGVEHTSYVDILVTF